MRNTASRAQNETLPTPGFTCQQYSLFPPIRREVFYGLIPGFFPEYLLEEGGIKIKIIVFFSETFPFPNILTFFLKKEENIK